MRLNPFVYIFETDVRFYLLVIIGFIVPSLWALIFGFTIVEVEAVYSISTFLRLSIMVPIFCFVPLLVYWNYKKFPKMIMKESKLKEFDEEKFPDHYRFIEKLYGEHLSTMKQPTLMYQPLDPSESAFTFGTKNHMYIGISGGLIRKFRKSINGFKSIFLHEMGHIANKDVEKTYLTVSTSRSLFLTLSIPLAISLLYGVYLTLAMLYFGTLAGYDMDYIISRAILGKSLLMLAGIILYFLIFSVILYVLRNQIIRLREFYADARVQEWEESPREIVKTLEESGRKQYSKFEILTKFHPNINERIQVLKDNSSLFTPSLWVAFSIGYFYGLLETRLPVLKMLIFSFEQMAMGNVDLLNVGFRAFSSIFVFTILMLAIGSSFHKSILKDTFIDNVRYFSTSTILNVIKFSLVFSLGWLTDGIVSHIEVAGGYLGQVSILVRDLPIYPLVWILHAVYFSIAMIFLSIFAPMLIRRSFSEKEAKKNFLMISILSSILYIINRFVAVEILHNKPLLIVFFLIFSVVTYTFIRIRDRKLCCPNCNNRISHLPKPQLHCPNCHRDLYSWAIYSFSKNPVS